MERREILKTIGALGGGGAVVTGTSAFTSVEAERDVSVEVAGDANALLRIAPSGGPNGAYATGADDGTLSLDFTDSNDNIDGEGINQDAVSYFDEVFVIENQGTQEVELSVSPLTFIELGTGVLLVVLVPLDAPAFDGTVDVGEPGADITDGLSQVSLGVGDTAEFSVLATSTTVFGGVGSDIGFEDELQITAEAN